jgi:hypothetical protein
MQDMKRSEARRFSKYIAARQWDGRTNARSDWVVLEFFVSFLFKQKRKELKTVAEFNWKLLALTT